MKQSIYIAEPKAIDAGAVRSLLPDTYEIISGTPDFGGEIPDNCSILMIRSGVYVDSSIAEKFPRLAHVIRVGTGVDNIDLDFCSARGIAVYNAPGANADAVSDYVIAMMFVALRKINTLTRDDVENWNRFKFTGHSMSGRSIGIIGFGNIGKQIFTKLRGFGCKHFFVYDPFIPKTDMPEGVTYAATVDEVLQRSDIVTLHVPLLDSTQDLLTKENMQLLPEGAIVINASRGGIVNEADIIELTGRGKLTYIADTVENEPQVNPELLGHDNVILTPHIASLTEESAVKMLEVAVENFLGERPMNKSM
jgi:D-3-phosphoglycerate dehydrogenase